MADVLEENGQPKWRVIGMYGWPETRNKHLTWSLMRELCNSNSQPTVLFGDFNEILSLSKKQGGAIRRERYMDEFRRAIDDCALHDLGFRGNIFTWQRGLTEETLIKERLDRALANTEWRNLFPNTIVQHLPIYSSDHAAIVIKEDCLIDRDRRRRSFKFEPFWMADDQCEGVIKEAWNSGVVRDVPRQVKECANELSEWAKQKFGNIKRRIRDKEKELCLWQRQPPSNDMLNKCRDVVTELDELRRQNETYWYTRARKCELRDGDKNTSYFHHKAKQRHKRNCISGIENNEGNWCTEEAAISTVIEEYFSLLFETSNPHNFGSVLECIPHVVSETMNLALDSPLLDDEIKAALFDMHPNKAPGPDGMHAMFYQKYWDIVGSDICSFVREWWDGRGSIDNVNLITNVILIPKCNSPTKISEFRPISLCNVLYKIISKSLANRLKPLLNDFITRNQSAFTPGRLITDNAIVAFETFHAMKRGGEGRHGNIALKLDMSKAYDRVEWTFLDEVMKKMGFSCTWRNRVLKCVTTVAHTFLINGKNSRVIRPSRGLRQGDPLSPYLFLICGDAFSYLLQQAVASGRIHGARVCRGAPSISHLFFADDNILFARASLSECSTIAETISLYKRASGQKINYSKSEVVFSKKIVPAMRMSLAVVLGVREVERHEKYLGIPTIIGKSKKAIFASLKERIWKKVQGWKEKLLSKPGKEILIKAVAQAIPTYLMSLFALPEGSIEELHMTMARFWWGSTETQRKIHWWRWDKLCMPKSTGGMGFRNLRVFNQALLAKQVWRMMINPHSLAGMVMKARYFKNCSILEARRGNDPSFIWRCLWGAKSLLLEGLQWRVGNDESIGVWDSNWLPSERGGRTPAPNMEADPSLRVVDLIDKEKRDWDRDVIEAALLPEEAHLVAFQGWYVYCEDGLLAWYGSPSGVGKLDGSGGGWCEFCDEEAESELHALVRCPWARDQWERSGFEVIVSSAPMLSFAGWLCGTLEGVNGEEMSRFLVVLWAIWAIRNERIFEEEQRSPDVVIMGFIRLVHDYQGYIDKTGVLNTAIRAGGRESWSPPLMDSIKINSDATIMNDGSVGMGAVGRDWRGELIFVACKRIEVAWSVDTAETKAMVFGLEVAHDLGLSQVCLETDAAIVVHELNRNQMVRSPLNLCAQEVKEMIRLFSCSGITHVRRSGNTIAQLCARICEAVGETKVFVSDFPSSVIILAEIDLI